MSPTKGEGIGRWDLRNPRIWTAIAHGLFSLACFIRPNLDVLFRAYEPFGNIQAWAVGMALLAAWLLLAPRGSWLLMVGHLTSSLIFFTIAGLLTAGVGILPTAGLAIALGCLSLVLFANTWQFWLAKQRWFAHLVAHPPRWVQRLLRLEHGNG